MDKVVTRAVTIYLVPEEFEQMEILAAKVDRTIEDGIKEIVMMFLAGKLKLTRA